LRSLAVVLVAGLLGAVACREPLAPAKPCTFATADTVVVVAWHYYENGDSLPAVKIGYCGGARP
jgi:hypothetical protein